MAARYHPDLVFCRRQVGDTIGLLCDKCDGRCPLCDSHFFLEEEVKICDYCASNSQTKGKCLICGAKGIHKALYCHECVVMGKHMDGCVVIVDLKEVRKEMKKKKEIGPDEQV
ncbi:PHF5-like protein [Aduncisulcus paluster]|uniref:PHF5-like protein n=1 Tax=Aduncisulcus paluster TaxID=2918883 RepID=A0ABQ5JQP5_9EUKA|nr:PHF5-like protein [Aduncisulcus paluster]